MFRIPRNLCPDQNHHVPRGFIKRGEFFVISGIFVFQAAASKIYRKHVIVSGMSSSFFSHNHYCELKLSQKTRYPYYYLCVLFVLMLVYVARYLLLDNKVCVYHIVCNIELWYSNLFKIRKFRTKMKWYWSLSFSFWFSMKIVLFSYLSWYRFMLMYKLKWKWKAFFLVTSAAQEWWCEM